MIWGPTGIASAPMTRTTRVNRMLILQTYCLRERGFDDAGLGDQAPGRFPSAPPKVDKDSWVRRILEGFGRYLEAHLLLFSRIALRKGVCPLLRPRSLGYFVWFLLTYCLIHFFLEALYYLALARLYLYVPRLLGPHGRL